MSTLVSLLGFQPAATVTVVRTLEAKPSVLPSPLEHIVLLATEAVRSARLVDRVTKSLAGGRATIEVRDLDMTTRADPMGWMRSVVADFTAVPERLVLHVDPGPQHLVTALTAALGPSATLLTSDVRHLVVIDEARGLVRTPVVDIGLEALLALHDLPSSASNTRSTSWNALVERRDDPASHDTRSGFRFDLPECQGVSFDLAYERGGHLFLLRAVRERGTAVLRATASIRAHLRGLRPVIGIISSNTHTLAQARALGLHGLHKSPARAAESAIRKWIEGQAIVPGPTQVLRTSADRAIDLTPMTGGGGDDGTRLACWLGTDASATLVCIATHRPSELWLVVDATSEPIAETLRRLRTVVEKLPCGTVNVVKSDIFGSKLVSRLSESPGFAAATSHGNLAANLSPGRKVQGLALARVTGASICTVDNRSGRVAWLDGNTTPDLPLSGPAIVAAATVIGGPLKPGSGGVAVRPDPSWAALARGLWRLAEQGHVPSPVVLLRRKHRRIRLNATGQCLALVLRDNEWILTLGDARARVIAEASLGEDPTDGRWFEWLVGAQFVAAGADEVWRNIEWAWTRRDPTTNEIGVEVDWPYHRAEVDVVARFGARFVVVSCKAGQFRQPEQPVVPGQPQHTVDEALREIEAVAAMGFGRFALPALAVPRATQRLSRQFRLHQGAAALDLSILYDPGLLREWVGAVADKRSPR